MNDLSKYSDNRLFKRIEEIRVELADFHVSYASVHKLQTEQRMIVTELKSRGYTDQSLRAIAGI